MAIPTDSRTKDAASLIANLLGWRIEDGNLIPPYDVLTLMDDMTFTITEDGLSVFHGHVALVGVWTHGEFVISQNYGDKLVPTGVSTASVESGIAWMAGAAYVLAVASLENFEQLRRQRKAASVANADEVASGFVDEVRGGDDDNGMAIDF